MDRRPACSERLSGPAPVVGAAVRSGRGVVRGLPLALVAFATLSCGGESPSEPTPPRAGSAATVEFGGGAALGASNALPVLRLKTWPEAVAGHPYPVVTGVAPLTVRFNLCESTDPDLANEENPEGDSLNWQFHFGDDGTPAFNDDGTFNPDFGHFCRTEHTYTEGGSYVATASVTDKHLEDQSRDVSATARVTESVTVLVDRQRDPPAPTPTPPLPYTYSGGRNGPINFKAGPERSFGIGGGVAAGWTEDGTYLLSGNPNRSPPVIVCPTGLGFPDGQVNRFTVLTAIQQSVDSNGLSFFVADAGSTIGGVSVQGCRIYVN
jgi:hypothetical protein